VSPDPNLMALPLILKSKNKQTNEIITDLMVILKKYNCSIYGVATQELI